MAETLAYDDLDRVTASSVYGEAGDARTTTTVYAGRTPATTNPLGQTKVETKDSLGLLAQATDAAGSTTLYGREPYGNLNKVTDPLGDVVSIVYDRLGRRRTAPDPGRSEQALPSASSVDSAERFATFETVLNSGSSVVVQLFECLSLFARWARRLMDTADVPRRRPRSLAMNIVDALGDRVRDGRLAVGEKLPTEAEIMGEFGVSRTVVREALSKLQAAGVVQTRHGIGTFVAGVGDATPFHIGAEQLGTLADVIAVLELRIGLETEAAGLAAQRRTERDLRSLREALATLVNALDDGRDAIGADFQFHLEIARATQNPHFVAMLGALGPSVIPRARIALTSPPEIDRLSYLRHVHGEHELIFEAIARQDAEAARAAMRIHLGNSRERRRKTMLVDDAGRPQGRAAR